MVMYGLVRMLVGFCCIFCCVYVWCFFNGWNLWLLVGFGWYLIVWICCLWGFCWVLLMYCVFVYICCCFCWLFLICRLCCWWLWYVNSLFLVFMGSWYWFVDVFWWFFLVRLGNFVYYFSSKWDWFYIILVVN